MLEVMGSSPHVTWDLCSCYLPYQAPSSFSLHESQLKPTSLERPQTSPVKLPPVICTSPCFHFLPRYMASCEITILAVHLFNCFTFCCESPMKVGCPDHCSVPCAHYSIP